MRSQVSEALLLPLLLLMLLRYLNKQTSYKERQYNCMVHGTKSQFSIYTSWIMSDNGHGPVLTQLLFNQVFCVVLCS